MLGPDFLGQGPHAGFILAAYCLTIATILGLSAWILLDYRTQTNSLADLERRGVTRRSARRGSNP
ncbi:MAG: heme exporter protein CcmD [Alphaproteobacteria bacterium]